MAEREMKYLLYRCQSCKAPITALQLDDRWSAAEALGVDHASIGACVCGGNRLAPTNVTLFEELTRPSLWRLWWVMVVVPWVKGWL